MVSRTGAGGGGAPVSTARSVKEREHVHVDGHSFVVNAQPVKQPIEILQDDGIGVEVQGVPYAFTFHLTHKLPFCE